MTSNRVVTLGEVCTFHKGASIPRDRTSTSMEIPYLHYGDIYKKYTLKTDIDEEFNDIIKISSSEKTRVEQQLHDQDIVYNLTSETIEDLGKSVIIRNKNEVLFVAGMETTILRVERRDLVYPPYLNYVLQTQTFYKLLQQYVTGMKVFRVHPRDISLISLAFPSLDEQKWIASIGDTLTNRVEINKKINHHLGAIKSATDNSPYNKRGSKLSLNSASRRFSKALIAICFIIGSTSLLKSDICSLLGISIGNALTSLWFNPGCAALLDAIVNSFSRFSSSLNKKYRKYCEGILLLARSINTCSLTAHCLCGKPSSAIDALPV